MGELTVGFNVVLVTEFSQFLGQALELPSMSASNEKWIDGLQFSSLFWPPPQDAQQKQNWYMFKIPDTEWTLGHISSLKAQILAYVEYFGQFTADSEQFPEDIAQKEYSEQWALACGEILRVLTHYNRPIFKVEHQHSEAECSSTSDQASSCDSIETKANGSPRNEPDRKPLRPLSPWITDILLAAPLGIRSDYFRWCGGVMGKYAAGGELKPPTTAYSRGSGKHPQLMPSTPRWAVANGAGVILSVCDEEVARYETANLTAAAVPALLLPPPTTPLDEHLVAGLPPLEPYARLFHRYYAIATPSATQRLLFGLLEAPPSWAPDALDAAVQLVELLRAAEDYDSGMRLPKNWMHLHFLRAIGTAMSMRAGIAADTSAALLFRILSQPTLLFPPLRQAEGVELHHEPLGGYVSSYKRQLEVPASEATIDATAQGIASLLCAHGPDVEWRICTIWEAAYGLLPLSSSAVDLPEIVVAAPLQPPTLSWSLYLPLLKVFEYLPRGSPSEACLMRIFVATVEAILRRTFPSETSEQSRKPRSQSKNLAVAELRTMIHSLFVESCASMDLASRLLFVVLTVCVSHQALPGGSKRPTGSDNHSSEEVADGSRLTNGRSRCKKKQGPVATFDSYVLAAVCALSCELQLFPFISKNGNHSNLKDSIKIVLPGKTNGISNELHNSISSAILHTRRILRILEALFSLKPSSVGTSWSYSSNEIVAAAMVAAHVSELFRRSRPCLNALSALKQCKWDAEISTRASSLYHLIDLHGKTVTSIVNKAEPLEAHLTLTPVKKDEPPIEDKNISSSDGALEKKDASSSHRKNGFSRPLLKCAENVQLNGDVASTSGKSIASLQVEASDLANFLTMDRNGGYRGSQTLLRSVLSEKQELCFSVVSLLWQKLIASPEMQMSAESTSAHQGWRKVVDALCDVVSASPTKASAAIVLQAEKDLQPWIARDDEQGQKMWRVNQRIVKLIAELMRNHDSPEALVILASASDLLLRATDGMLVDGEACTLPQLECRLSTTIRCLSHPSAHVRALSMSVLRDILNSGQINPSKLIQGEHRNGIKSPTYQCLAASIINWQADVERCIEWEAHSRRATGLTLAFLTAAAKELGCPLAC
uniref:Gigantea n=1 Tax=Leersia perrieri TaxID=77586 RepID=A0A0D9UXK8_9ORYZ